jgi:hypothetical protein
LDLLSAAIEYARLGWSIIPTIGKKSAHHWKQFQARPADEPTLRSMFGCKDITGLAVILGSASGGLACRDFDDAESYRRWAADHPELAATLPTARTARGNHVYLLGPEGFKKHGDGEYRATSGHYCLLPPSLHPSGSVYSWLVPLPSGGIPVVDPVQVGLLTQELPEAQDTYTLSHPSPNTHLCERGKILTAITETLPTAKGQRRDLLFRLAQRLKANMPNARSTELKAIVRQWFDLALPVIGSKEWAESWEDFVGAWGSVRHPMGSKWAEVVQAAEMNDVDTYDHDGAAARIMRLCATLQMLHGPGKSWPLSCRLAGEFAKVTRERAARILKMLAFEGVIELVTPGGTKGSKRAAEYRYLQG